jgi:hypothetical protein
MTKPRLDKETSVPMRPNHPIASHRAGPGASRKADGTATMVATQNIGINAATKSGLSFY